jgi:hypothetical protein
LVEQHPCIFEDRRVEAFGESTVDWREEIASLSALALITPLPWRTIRTMMRSVRRQAVAI